MAERIAFLAQAIQHHQSEMKRIATIDLSFEDFRKYCPITLRQG